MLQLRAILLICVIWSNFVSSLRSDSITTPFKSKPPLILTLADGDEVPTGVPLTFNNTSSPTDAPTVEPTFNNDPTHRPTKAPTARPTQEPTTVPSNNPSVDPSANPSVDPTCEPTHTPTFEPTVEPTFNKDPTHRPSKAPTARPTQEPTTAPSCNPSVDPSAIPSVDPTCEPTRTPTFAPSVSFYPTSWPTSSSLPRYFQCDALTCEYSDNPDDCSFASGNIFLQCVDAATPCAINTNSLYVGPHTALSVTGGCPLVVTAVGNIMVSFNSSVKAASISMTTTRGNVVLFGTISTSGQGPLKGPGSPSAELLGQGGSYGGSSGRPHCNNTYFSNIPSQLGSINVLDDLSTTSPNYNATFGSGGGARGAGRGGGRVVIKTLGNVLVEVTGSILADGSSPDEHNYKLGAGSGGSIFITSNECVLNGKLSARGGDSFPGHSHAGAAGGGGRISVIVASLNSTTGTLGTADSDIYVQGGYNAYSHCRGGSSGTAYIQLGRSAITGFHLFNAALMVNNNHQRSFAVSHIDTMPPATNVLSVTERSVITSKKALSLVKMATCPGNEPSHTACSSITLQNSTFVALSNVTEEYTEREGTVFTLMADDINIISSELSGQIYTHYSLNISARNFFVSDNSTMFFSGSFIVHTDVNTNIEGLILQIPGKRSPIVANSYYHRAFASIVAKKNVTFSNLITSNFRAQADRVHFNSHKFANSPFGFIPQACQESVAMQAFSCDNYRYTGTLKFNNTYVIIGDSSITFGTRALLEAAQVLLCAPNITIGDGAAVSANQRGCSASHGLGAGGAPSSPSDPNIRGGGGGGYGGVGGYGFNNVGSGGDTYNSDNTLNSGSGGGCFNCNLTYSGAGGGIINIVAYDSLVLNGNLSSNGGFGGANSGGGSGGTVSINALAMSGRGYITVWGGGGGNGQYPGGGGGGGVLTMFNPQDYYLEYNYVGVVSALGGPPGHFVLFDPAMSDGSSDPAYMAVGESRILQAIPPNANYYIRGTADQSSQEIAPLDDDPAISGQEGVLNLPTCPPGYGNGVSTGTVCGLCPVGTYGPGDGYNICYACTNRPKHSQYTDAGVKDDDCPYECNSGYSTVDCYTPFQNFLFHTLGVVGLTLSAAGIFALIFMPLLYLRYKKEYSWYEDHRKIVLPTDAFTHVDEFRNNDRKHRSGRKSSLDESFADYSVDNPLSADHGGEASEVSDEHSKVGSLGGASQSTTGTSLPKAFQRMNRDLRLRFRMGDSDLPQHACRINFLGSNHPDELRGGPWVLPSSRPPCMRPMLKRQEYRAFAEKINKRMEWKPYGIEMLTFYTVAIVAPPLAAFLMRQFRKRRANLLLKLIANYDYACFRCPTQRLQRTGLRVGISPDATLAYMDFLYDEDKSSVRMKPLCPLGQVKLPATFKLAGLGTYSSPYYVDTNDLILQAVSQTDIPSSFINESWISFVVELNTVLRTVQTDSLFYGVRRLIRFLSEEQHVTNLGGLVVEFCTFSNIETVYASELTSEDSPEDPSQRNPSRLVSVSGTVPRARNTSWEKWIMKQRTSDLTLPPMMTSFSQAPLPSELRGESERSPGFVPNSVDLDYSSPQMSIDVRESFVQKSVINAVTCVGYCWGCVVYVFQVIMACFCMCRYNNSLTLTDPVGYALSFVEMCQAIRCGQLKMGIIVTHPKVVAYNYIVQDEDYESEEDEYYQDHCDDGPRNRMASSQDSGSYKSSLQSLPHIFGMGSDVPGSAVKTPMSNKANSALRRTYGDKADEVAKFYNIMLAAESSLGGSGKNNADKTVSPSTSPSAPSTMAGIISAVKVPVKLTEQEAESKTDPKTNGETAVLKDPPSPRSAHVQIHAPDQQEYTDLSPFRHSKIRRPSEMNLAAMALRESDVDGSTLGRLTEEEIAHLQHEVTLPPEHQHQHHPRRVSEDSRDSGTSGSNGGEEDVTALEDSRNNSRSNSRTRSKSETKLNPGEHLPAFAYDDGEFSHTRSAIKHLVSPVTLDRKSIAARKSKRISIRTKQQKDLSKEHLANSAFQAPVNSWRIDANGDLISDGLQRIQEQAMLQQGDSGRSFSDASAVSSTSSNAPQSAEGSLDFANRMNNLSVQVRVGDLSVSAPPRTPTPAGRPLSLKATTTASGAKSPWFNIRSFIGGGLNSESRSPTSASHNNAILVDPRTQREDVRSITSSDVGSVNNNDGASDLDSDRGQRTVRQQDVEAGTLTVPTVDDRDRHVKALQVAHRRQSFKRGGLVKTAAYQPFYLSGLLFFYVRSFMLGANVYPWGPKYLHKVFELVLFLLCLVDMALSIIVLVSAYCASHDATSCSDHTSMILITLVWPGALTIAPIMGLIMVILGPSGTLARMYALWSRIAFINSAMVIWSLVYYYDYYSNIANSYYPMLLLPSSRVFQCLVVDLYIAHIEKLRYTRGWDGLHTSLFKTQDNMKEVN